MLSMSVGNIEEMTYSEQLTRNARILEAEFAWFESLLQSRLPRKSTKKTVVTTTTTVEIPKRTWWDKLLGRNKYDDTPPLSEAGNTFFETTPTPSKAIDMPDLTNDNSFYARFVAKNNLLREDRLVIVLALAPHIKPQLLDNLFLKDAQNGLGNAAFGGIKGNKHGGFLPTVETVFFLLAGGNLDYRLKASYLFHPDSELMAHNIIRLVAPPIDEPFEASQIALSDDALADITKGETWQPNFSSEFPAKKLTTPLQWKDLAMTAETAQQLFFIEKWLDKRQAFARQFSDLHKLKPGFKALFYGPSGTGKTLTAALLGKKYGLDVYRVDLSMIVSKYIGETEKNLEKIFAKAEGKNWILFFDEADALFGKRTDVADAHDKYANQEVSYLLQRLEDYQGLVILASNMQHNIDDAFKRRMQTFVYFPRPSFAEKKMLWQNALAMSGIDTLCNDYIDTFATQYDLTGAGIVNAVHYATLHTMDMNIRDEQSKHDKEIHEHAQNVMMHWLFEGIRKEYIKEGRNF
jgi:hypothetical protein